MIGLMQKLQSIQNDCVEKQGLVNQYQLEDHADEFTRIKKKVAVQVKNIRQLIHDRDDMERTSQSVDVVALSHQIHQFMKEAEKDTKQLDLLQKEEKATYIKRNKQDEEKEKQIEHREEVVGTVIDHLEECRLLAQKRHGESAFSSVTSRIPSDPLLTSLPDIDQPGFQVLRKNDQVIEVMLDDLVEGIKVVKGIAGEMNQEATRQEIMLDDLDENVTRAIEHLDSINQRLRKVLTNVRKGDRFIVDIILLCVLLGLIGYIYSIVK